MYKILNMIADMINKGFITLLFVTVVLGMLFILIGFVIVYWIKVIMVVGICLCLGLLGNYLLK